jgi:uncharacterized protein (TIGR02001 family)
MANNTKSYLTICLSGAALCIVAGDSFAAAAKSDADSFPGTFSGSIAGVTDYRYRGISQTQEDPALQAGIEYNHPSGFKLGAWGSNVDFGSTEGSGSLETDIYGAYTWNLSDSLSVETGIYGYLYPGSSSNLNYNYGEGYALANYTYDIVTITGALNYSPDNFGSTGEEYYPQLSASVALPREITLDGAIGKQWYEDNAAVGLPDYTNWNLGAAYTWQDFTSKLNT